MDESGTDVDVGTVVDDVAADELGAEAVVVDGFGTVVALGFGFGATVRGVVALGVAGTACVATDAGRTRMYTTSVMTKTSVVTTVERRTR